MPQRRSFPNNLSGTNEEERLQQGYSILQDNTMHNQFVLIPTNFAAFAAKLSYLLHLKFYFGKMYQTIVFQNCFPKMCVDVDV